MPVREAWLVSQTVSYLAS